MNEEKLLLEFDTKNLKKKKKVERELMWYDSYLNKMWKIWGGELRYRWDTSSGRMVPKVKWNNEKKRWETENYLYEYTYVRSNNKKEIQEWIDDVGSRLGAEVDDYNSSDKGIAINIDKTFVKTVEYSLDRHGIKFDNI